MVTPTESAGLKGLVTGLFIAGCVNLIQYAPVPAIWVSLFTWIIIIVSMFLVMLVLE